MPIKARADAESNMSRSDTAAACLHGDEDSSAPNEGRPMTTYPMSPVDAAWYHMDGPANLAMVTGILLTKERLDFERVRAVYKRRLIGFDRFRQRVVERGFPVPAPQWEDMPNFDIDQHIHHVALPAPHDKASLTALINDIASAPLDHEQPLWQVHVVDDVEGGSALIMRYHHCIGDGTAMMAVTQRLYDTTRNASLQAVRASAAKTDGGRAASVLTPSLDAVARAARKALAAAGSAVDILAHPQQLIGKAAAVLEGTGMLVTELLKSPDPQSPLKGKFGSRKHVAWSKPVAIEDIKAIGAPSGAKVNDVLVAGMTGALRAYLKRRGVDVDRMTVRAMVPVDLRPPERRGELGNEFGLVVLDLAVAVSDSMDRLATTKARMDALKRSPEAVATLVLFNIFGRGPKMLGDFANEAFSSKASVVMTNVAGPNETLYLAGVPIDRMMFWVPHPGNQLGMGISILSYKGMASLAVIADARLVPDPEAITNRFNREFAQMLRRVQADAASGPARKPAARKRVAKTVASPAATAQRSARGTKTAKRQTSQTPR
jgi:diacylglycerol O-acyltransferase / wax synthase